MMIEAYSHAAASLGLWVILAIILSGLTAMSKEKAGYIAGGTPADDYDDPVYRKHRAYLNSIEGLTLFAAAIVAAIIAGAAPFWINLFASIAVLSRYGMAYVHIKAISAPSRGLRSILYGIATLGTFLIAIFALLAAFA